MDAEHLPSPNPVDAGEMAAGLGVSLPYLRERLGFALQTGQPDGASSGFEQALRPPARALEILGQLFHDPATIRVWLRTPHPDLDGCTALETILDGQAQAVCIILESALCGVPV